MSNIEDYNTKLEVIKAIPDDQITPPNSIPVGIYIQVQRQPGTGKISMNSKKSATRPLLI